MFEKVLILNFVILASSKMLFDGKTKKLSETSKHIIDAARLIMNYEEGSVHIVVDNDFDDHAIFIMRPVLFETFDNFQGKIETELVMFFIKSFENLKPMKVKISSNIKHGRKFLIIVGNKFQLNLKKLFEWLLQCQVLDVNVMVAKDDTVFVYTFLPFGVNKCENVAPVVINKFINGQFVNDAKDFFPDKTSDMNNCPVRIATSEDSQPYVFIDKLENGTFVGSGRDFRMLNTLGEVLNFEIVITHVSGEGLLTRNGTATGPFLMLLQEKADLIVADYWLQIYRLVFVDSSVPYYSQHIALMIPPGSQLSSFEKFVLPLDMPTWILLLTIFFIGFTVILLINKFASKDTKDFVFGPGVQYPALNLFGAVLGGSQRTLPKMNFARFLLMMFLIFCFVMRTLYGGSLYGFLQSKIYNKEVQSINDMIKRDYKIYYIESTREFFSSPPEKLRNR